MNALHLTKNGFWFLDLTLAFDVNAILEIQNHRLSLHIISKHCVKHEQPLSKEEKDLGIFLPLDRILVFDSKYMYIHM